MSRAYDFTVITVVWIIAIVIHMVAVELFDPSGALYTVATKNTEAMNGAARAALWHEILVVWVPLMAGGGIIAWGVIREYRRQVLTTTGRSPR